MHDPGTHICSFGPFMLYHEDPCTDGSDDSCGWFMRAKHGNPEVLKRIRSEIEHQFDRVFEYRKDDWDDAKKKAGTKPDSIHFLGYFCPNGDPNYSVHGIALNMFREGAREYFKDKWERLPWIAKWRPWHRDRTAYMWWHAERWMRDNLYDIMFFAENPIDSLREGIVGTFGDGGDRSRDRESRIDSYASCVYGWILRDQRPWYRHPRWHFHHWDITIHWWWFVPTWLQRKLRPSHFSCNAASPSATVSSP